MQTQPTRAGRAHRGSWEKQGEMNQFGSKVPLKVHPQIVLGVILGAGSAPSPHSCGMEWAGWAVLVTPTVCPVAVSQPPGPEITLPTICLQSKWSDN